MKGRLTVQKVPSLPRSASQSEIDHGLAQFGAQSRRLEGRLAPSLRPPASPLPPHHRRLVDSASPMHTSNEKQREEDAETRAVTILGCTSSSNNLARILYGSRNRGPGRLDHCLYDGGGVGKAESQRRTSEISLLLLFFFLLFSRNKLSNNHHPDTGRKSCATSPDGPNVLNWGCTPPNQTHVSPTSPEVSTHHARGAGRGYD
ncbi:hypothetical protein BS50DRAFT_141116 [Corynespora cassiicola Philippines]|uniref:Uncharacterized protein n=1 Tax=Corynespora cassiicola Philippines TaxID=1448308 RepID=A0A2T2N9Y8_CORCC|nr:hypothetical protein BS50DRAFT_141116 [Corynespora cassiicola Philippines]